MKHIIPYFFRQNEPLPIPHFLKVPITPKQKTFHAIIPSDLIFKEGDTVSKSTSFNDDHKVFKILERRTAKGDWSAQKVHKNPDIVKYTSF